MAQGDEWRFPGLGKMYCTTLPPRVHDGAGKSHRSLDACTDKLRAKCEFSPFRPVLEAVAMEDEES